MSYKVSVPEPRSDANKYSRGKLIIVAGSSSYPGAAVLSALASQRMGAGYTEVVTAKSCVDLVRGYSPSLVVKSFSKWNACDLPEASERRPCAVCVGSGFVPDDSLSEDLVVDVLKNAHCPVLVDGGALSCLSSPRALKQLGKRADRGFATVVTPHGGEAARLVRSLSLNIVEPRKLAAGLALALPAVVVLKGPDTYVSDATHTEVMREGTAALAKAGTGDVLAGMISALLAQGVSPFDAALTGATVHARAGVEAANRLTAISVCAEDVIESIPFVLRSL